MFVDLEIRLEATDDGKVVWWATADAIPGLSCAADTLSELRNQAAEAIAELMNETGETVEAIREKLVGTTVEESIYSDEFELRTMPFLEAVA